MSSSVWHPGTPTSIQDKYELCHALKLFGVMVDSAENFHALLRFIYLTANWSNLPDKESKPLLRIVRIPHLITTIRVKMYWSWLSIAINNHICVYSVSFLPWN